MVTDFCPVVFEVVCPLWLIFGQYLQRLERHSICKLLELVLKTNNFEFDNKEFLQVGGTAMGTKLAPSFANLFMGYFEEEYVAPYSKQPFLWKRFIDDILIIWTYGQDELTRFATAGAGN